MRIKVIALTETQGQKQGIIEAVIIKSPDPVVGGVYDLLEYDEQTDKQRKAFHPLVKLYFNSGCYNHECRTWLELKDYIKRDIGEGYEYLEYADKNYTIVKIKYADKDKIPDYVLLDYANGNKKRIKGILKSTAKYSRKQYSKMIDSLCREMISSGVLDSKFGKEFQDILTDIKFEE